MTSQKIVPTICLFHGTSLRRFYFWRRECPDCLALQPYQREFVAAMNRDVKASMNAFVPTHLQTPIGIDYASMQGSSIATQWDSIGGESGGSGASGNWDSGCSHDSGSADSGSCGGGE